jgi:hypothetical protein
MQKLHLNPSKPLRKDNSHIPTLSSSFIQNLSINQLTIALLVSDSLLIPI